MRIDDMSRSQLINHVKALQDEISILRDRLLPAATGHIHTTINTLEGRLKECQAELDKGKCNG